MDVLIEILVIFFRGLARLLREYWTHALVTLIFLAIAVGVSLYFQGRSPDCGIIAPSYGVIIKISGPEAAEFCDTFLESASTENPFHLYNGGLNNLTLTCQAQQKTHDAFAKIYAHPSAPEGGYMMCWVMFNYILSQ